MRPEHLVAFTDTRPHLHYSTIDVGPIVFSERPENDDIVEIPGDGLRLNSHDSSGYPTLRLEHYSEAPEDTPSGDWDYQRTFQDVSTDAPVAVLSMFGDRYGELAIPDGLYDMRVLLRRVEQPEQDDEIPEFIDFDDDEIDEPLEDPEEHWLIQLWPVAHSRRA